MWKGEEIVGKRVYTLYMCVCEGGGVRGGGTGAVGKRLQDSQDKGFQIYLPSTLKGRYYFAESTEFQWAQEQTQMLKNSLEYHWTDQRIGPRLEFCGSANSDEPECCRDRSAFNGGLNLRELRAAGAHVVSLIDLQYKNPPVI